VIPNRPPQFNGGTIPLLGQQQAQAQAAIAQAVSQLSLAIYSRAASDALDDHRIEPHHFKQLARNAQAAAQAYFTGLGIVKSFQPNEGNNAQEE